MNTIYHTDNYTSQIVPKYPERDYLETVEIYLPGGTRKVSSYYLESFLGIPKGEGLFIGHGYTMTGQEVTEIQAFIKNYILDLYLKRHDDAMGKLVEERVSR